MAFPTLAARLSALGLLLPLAGAATQGDQAPPAADYFATLVRAGELFDRGQWAEAGELYAKLASWDPENGFLVLQHGTCLARAGENAAALTLLERAVEMGQGFLPYQCFEIARLHAIEGSGAAACDWLEKALAARYEDRPSLAAEPAFAGLLEDARFRRIAGLLSNGELAREAGWRHDLAYFLEEVRRLHADPARPAFDPAYVAAVGSLASRAGELSDEEVALGILQLAVRLGDGHSALYPVSTDRVRFLALPVQLYFFSDGLFVVDGEGPGAEWIGYELVDVGGESVAGIERRLEPYVPRDNAHGILWIGPRLLSMPSVLADMGFPVGEGAVDLGLRDESGAVVRVQLAATAIHERDSKLRPPAALDPERLPLWQSRMDTPYWHRALPELDALYVQFNQVRDGGAQTIAQFAADVQRVVAEDTPRHLILDLRHNNGGNNFLIWPMIRALVAFETSTPDHELFVLTGRNTFSACQNFLNYVERVCEPTIVGEPSSSKPNFTGESTNVLLPWSGLALSISSRYWQDSFPGDRRPWIPPQVPVELSSLDHFTGRDPALEAIADVIAMR